MNIKIKWLLLCVMVVLLASNAAAVFENDTNNETPQYSGYIIEFNEIPMIEKQVELQGQAGAEIPECNEPHDTVCVIDNNPKDSSDVSCLAGMQQGDTCSVNWQVNATGEEGSIYKLFVRFISGLFSADTSVVDVSVSGVAAPEVCNGIDDDCDGEIDELPECTDADLDGIPDTIDKCADTVAWFASEGLRPNHYDSSNMDYAATYGCGCDQILFCKPGANNGEYKFGCTEGTMNVWATQTGWSLDCQAGGIVAMEGEPKDLFENTDNADLPDIIDGDNDNDAESLTVKTQNQNLHQ
jgi:hypothetical protein